MITRLLGAAMIVTASSSWGWRAAARLEARPQQLRALMSMLEMLETDISYGGVPLPVALRRIGRTLPEPAGPLARDTAARLGGPRPVPVAEAWRLAVDGAAPRSALQAADWTIMTDLGEVLGASDREDQVRHLRLAHARLGQAIAPAEEEARRLGRVWRSLGLFGGLGLVLALY